MEARGLYNKLYHRPVENLCYCLVYMNILHNVISSSNVKLTHNINLAINSLDYMRYYNIAFRD